MTAITFTQNAKGQYEATLGGFTGVLQIDRSNASTLAIYAKTDGCTGEEKQYEDHSVTTLLKANYAECISLRIVCEENPLAAQYEAE